MNDLKAKQESKQNYLELESDFKGEISYDIEIPFIFNEHALLKYPISKEAFCSYRPTTLESQSIWHLAGLQETGPLFDLIDAASTFATTEDDVLSPEDAALLVNVVPGIREKTLLKTSEPTNKYTTNESETESADFIHPTKPDLKPIKVIPVLLPPSISKHKYLHISLQQITNPFILELNEAVSQRLRNYSLYNKINKNEYSYIRDFIAKFPDKSGTNENFIFDIPASLQMNSTEPTEEDACVYLYPLHGPKILFNRVTEPSSRRQRENINIIKIKQS